MRKSFFASGRTFVTDEVLMVKGYGILVSIACSAAIITFLSYSNSGSLTIAIEVVSGISIMIESKLTDSPTDEPGSEMYS